MTGKLSQVQAARLMYAAAQWADAVEDYYCKGETDQLSLVSMRAEAAFAELVAGMTCDETETDDA